MLAFGADPTGSTDSTNAILDAAATGQDVFLPAGTYLWDASRTLYPTGGQAIVGDDAVIQLGTSDTPQPIFRVLADDVTVEGIRLRGNGAANPNHGLEVRGARNFTGRRLHTSGFKDGGYVGSADGEGCTHITLEDVTCDGNQRNGWTFTHVHGATVRRLVGSNTAGIDPGYGIDVEPGHAGESCTNLTFEDCECAGNYRQGFVLTGHAGLIRDVQWIDGRTHGNQQDGIRVYGAERVTLGGHSWDNGRDQVRIEGESVDVTCAVTEAAP